MNYRTLQGNSDVTPAAFMQLLDFVMAILPCLAPRLTESNSAAALPLSRPGEFGFFREVILVAN